MASEGSPLEAGGAQPGKGAARGLGVQVQSRARVKKKKKTPFCVSLSQIRGLDFCEGLIFSPSTTDSDVGMSGHSEVDRDGQVIPGVPLLSVLHSQQHSEALPLRGGGGPRTSAVASQQW